MDETYSWRRVVALELLNVEVLDEVCAEYSQLYDLNVTVGKNAPRRATVLVAKVRCERATVRAYTTNID